MEKYFGSKGYAGGVLMDLSKAFDTLDHGVLLVKLHAYGMNNKSISINRKESYSMEYLFKHLKIKGIAQHEIII